MDVEILCISGLAWMLFLNMDVRNLDVFDFCFQKKDHQVLERGFLQSKYILEMLEIVENWNWDNG